MTAGYGRGLACNGGKAVSAWHGLWRLKFFRPAWSLLPQPTAQRVQDHVVGSIHAGRARIMAPFLTEPRHIVEPLCADKKNEGGQLITLHFGARIGRASSRNQPLKTELNAYTKGIAT